eukprot:PITA_29439
MSFTRLRLEYALEGSMNYIAWKERMEAVLDDNGWKEFIEMDVPKPTDATQADAWQKKTAKSQRILLEGVKDHIVSSLHGKCRDELGSVGVAVDDEDLVSLALLGLLKSWHSYQDSVNGREELSGWERLWSDLVQEDIKLSTRDGSSSKGADEENCALAAKAKKEKSKKSCQSGEKGKKQDMSKVKCFHCHQHGHYATNSSQKKKNKQAAGSAGGESLASQFELNFSLITCLVSSVMGSVWFLDNGASFHMTGDRYLFSYLEDKDLGVHIEMGDDGRYSATSIDTISFERESSKPFVLKEVMHVLGLKKNIISVVMLEYKEHDVVFSKGKSFLRSKTTGETRNIGVRVRNLYQLHVDGCATMVGKAEGLKKSETYSKFCEFKALVEKESGKKVKALGSDNGGEYISDEFKDFCKAEGIQRDLIAPHNPQQNGVAEWKNRMIVGAAQAMLHD